MSRAYVVEASRRVVWAALAALVVALAIASPAAAVPKGIFGVFAGCPASEVSESSVLCVYQRTVGGLVRIGRATVPIDRTITMQGGAVSSGVVNGLSDLVPPSGGALLSKTPLEVPGGLNGLVQCGALGGRLAQASCGAAACTEVTATIEVVAGAGDPATISLLSLFTSFNYQFLVLPSRIHLGNAFLGNSCYIGSGSHPIMLELMFGTTQPPAPNRPISGNRGTSEEPFEDGLGVLMYAPSTLVGNAFSIPVAEGCGGQFSSLVDLMVDTKLGLPSAAGHNTAILDAGVLDAATAEDVIESEE